MKYKNYNLIACYCFLFIGLLYVIKTYSSNIGDFGNYYYGSKLFLNNLFTKEMYTSLHYFNSEIGKLGETNYFENYIPVPPITAILYTPLCFLKPLAAKCIFNVLSLLFFCYSLFRLLSFLNVKQTIIILLPFLFLIPLYSNIYQGQSYLLICSGIMLAYIYSESNKVQAPAIIIALCVSLKIFPAFILLYFILTKRYKVAAYTILYVFILFLITITFININTVIYYYREVLPRLIDNDIIGSYSSINQSIFSLLINLFTENGIEKTTTLINYPILVPIIEAIFISGVLYYMYANKYSNSFFLYGLVLFSSSLINRYNTTYSLILLIPFLIHILNEFELNRFYVVLLILFLISINIPIGNLIHHPIILRFSRIILFLLIFVFVLTKFRVDIKFKPLFCIIGCAFILKYFTFNLIPANYFEVQNSKGILYDIHLDNNTLILKSTLGQKNSIEVINLNGTARFDPNLLCIDNVLKFKNTVICNTPDNKSKPFIYNDSLVVFMSDLNQGVRFYKLRYIYLQNL